MALGLGLSSDVTPRIEKRTAAPGVTDDISKGFKVGDIIVDETNDTYYGVVDITLGAAVWKRLDTSGGGGMTELADDTSPTLGGALDGGGFAVTNLGALTMTGTLAVTGNITASGTVDGRDVSVDGTKLDGIETAADVTDEANVKAALDGMVLTGVTVATNDKVFIEDTSDSDNVKSVTTQSIANLAAASTFTADSGSMTLAPAGSATVAGGTNCTSSISGSTITLNVDDAFLLNNGDTGTGAYDFGGADSLEIPNSAAPTVNAAGEIALDTTITDHQPMVKYYSGTDEMVIPAIKTADLTTTDGHTIKYDAANDKFIMGAPAGGGGDGSIYFPFRTNAYYLGDFCQWSGSAMNPTHDRLYYVPITIPSSTTITRIGTYVSTGASAGSTIRLGLYNDGGGKPGTLITDAGTVAANSTGEKEITISQTLAAGRYFMCAGINITGGTLATYRTALTDSGIGVLGHGDSTSQQICQYGYFDGGGASALSSDVTSQSNTFDDFGFPNVPAIFIRKT